MMQSAAEVSLISCASAVLPYLPTGLGAAEAVAGGQKTDPVSDWCEAHVPSFPAFYGHSEASIYMPTQHYCFFPLKP